MHFANPLLLLGMLAALLPIAIHLINRQRAKRRRFAALAFLLLSDKRLARRLKLKQLIVLALRVLLLLAIPFALAKPYLEPAPSAAIDAGEPGSVVLVVDDSASMQATLGGETLLALALERARGLVDKGGPQTSFAVVASGRPARLLTPRLTYDKDAVLRALERLTPSMRSGDLSGALREAERVLLDSPEPRRHVFVVGDQAEHAWASVAEAWGLAQIPDAEVVDVRDAAPIANLAIAGVTASADPDSPTPRLLLDVLVVNHGPARVDSSVTVSVLGEKVAGRITLGPGEAGTKTLAIAGEVGSGIVRGTASLAADAVPVDDTWYFTVDLGGSIRVGVVNGAPSEVAFLDEVFFVRPALAPGAHAVGRVEALYMTPSDLDATSLEHLDGLVLANVGSLTQGQRIAIEGFVGGGGGLLIAVGDKVTVASSASYGALMPFPLRDIKQVADRRDKAAALRALTFATGDYEHPIMRDFAALEDASLFKARVYQHALVDATPRDGAGVVLSYTGGIPALVEARIGKGRALMLTTTLDRDWTDLPIRSSYLPLIQQSVLYMTRRLGDSDDEVLTVGDSPLVAVPEGSGPVVLERPDGAEVRMAADEVPAAGPMQLPEADVVGHYTLRRLGATRGGVTVAVNVDRAESDLAPADPDDVAELLVRPGKGTVPSIASATAKAPDASGPRMTKLWPWVILTLFGLLASEAWLVIRT